MDENHPAVLEYNRCFKVNDNFYMEDPLFTEDECKKICETVLENRESLYDREDGKFYTFGAAKYLDCQSVYYHRAIMSNVLLEKNFGDMYVRLYRYLSDKLNMYCTHLSGAARPGFHIFEGNHGTRTSPYHIDGQFNTLNWPEPFSNPLSFTVALALPDENSGMECIIEGKEQEMPYKVGNIYLHSGLFQHRIKDTKTISKDKPRITLQGHGGTLQFSRLVGFYF